eukprot:SM000006S19381  [mRNA]  locus=s6:484260:485632:- [translate_table: standard]
MRRSGSVEELDEQLDRPGARRFPTWTSSSTADYASTPRGSRLHPPSIHIPHSPGYSSSSGPSPRFAQMSSSYSDSPSTSSPSSSKASSPCLSPLPAQVADIASLGSRGFSSSKSPDSHVYVDGHVLLWSEKQAQAGARQIVSAAGHGSQHGHRQEVRESRAADANEEGVDRYSRGDYRGAYICYSEAVKNCRKASYFGNRAAAALKLAWHAQAAKDAETAVSMNPCYTKGYIRAGGAYLRWAQENKARGMPSCTVVDKLERAEHAYGRALIFDSHNHYAQNGIENVRELLAEEKKQRLSQQL